MIGRWVHLVGFSCAVAALGIVGCAVNQEKEVNTYRQVLDQGTSADAGAFESGQPLTLQKSLQLANAHNEELSLSGEDYLQALIDQQRAVSNFLPTLGLAPTYYQQDPTGQSGGGASAVNHRLDVPVTGQINLFNGFRDLADYRRAGFTAQQQRALMLDLQSALLLQVAQAYYQILQSEGSVRVLGNSLRVQEERVRDIHARQSAGIARPLDVAQTEALAAATRVQLVQARADVNNGRTALAFLTAAPVADSPLVDNFDLGPTPPLPQMIQQALQGRQDLLAAARAVQAARQNVEFAFGQYYPTISLNLNYYLSRQSVPTDSQWNALLSANVPIFAAGRIHQEVRAAWSQWRQALLRQSFLTRQVEQDVRIAYQNIQTTEQRLAELHTQLTAAQEAFRQAEQSYNVGLATNLERLTAQDQLLSTELDLTREQFTRKIDYLNLLRITGELSPTSPLQLSPTTQPTTAPTTRP